MARQETRFEHRDVQIERIFADATFRQAMIDLPEPSHAALQGHADGRRKVTRD